MTYHMTWLNYQKQHPCNNWVDTVYVFSEENAVIRKDIVERGIQELKNFAKCAFDIELVIIQSTYNKGIEKKSTALYCTIGDFSTLGFEGYHIYVQDGMYLEVNDPKGFLYGIFRLIHLLRLQALTDGFQETAHPSAPLRMINHWDNMDGSIERGYSGRSFFFVENEIVVNERTKDYARLLASVGINGIVLNNVNVKDEATQLLTPKHRSKLKQLGTLLASYGIQLFLSVDYCAPMTLGGLSTSDPLAPEVVDWWENTAKEFFEALPECGGFMVKADSEGRPGPFAYGRNHADGANMLARIVKPYGGIIVWRCFVYNCQQDWRDRITDRAKSSFDCFQPLDGQFDENVILQVKNGPMDFQIREPVSPLFGAMKQTNLIAEFQLAQEYTGHQIDLCYLVPLFKEVLDFKTHCAKENDTVSDIVCGRTHGNPLGGIAAVSNVGNDWNWTGHDLAAANLYGFGRLCFQNELSAETIADEWIQLTYGKQKEVCQNIRHMLLTSRATYEKYTTPLGIGWMVKPGLHYGPDVDGYEYDRWGTYHRADTKGLGVDRSARGTGYANQYNEPLATQYNNIATCPEDLLLFFHAVSYEHILSDGETLIQYYYDQHVEGVQEVEELIRLWAALKDYIPADRFENVAKRLQRQHKNAVEWRDVVCTYFYRKSGIADRKRHTITF